MNRKLLVSLFIIMLLSSILIVKRYWKSSDVPELPAWSDSADEIMIRKKDGLLSFTQKEGRWLMKEGYRADSVAVGKMLKAMKELQLIDLISSKGQYSAYDLDAEKAVRVTVKKSGAVLRDVLIGKKSSTGRQTYLKLGDRPEVFLASGAIIGDFNKPAGDYRDKVIFKIARSGIEYFTIAGRGGRFTLEQKAPEAKPADDAKKAVKKDDAKKAAEDKKDEEIPGEEENESQKGVKWVSRDKAGAELDQAKVNMLASSFNPLRASAFPDVKKEGFRNPLCTVTIRAYKRDIVLSVFEQSKENKDYFCTSSESDHVFTLSKETVDRYLKGMQEYIKK